MKLTTQVIYDAYSSAFFTNVEPHLSWPLIVTDKHDANREANIHYFKKQWGIEVDSYELRKLPTAAKRNDFDSAKLLVIKLLTCEVIAKRHNNSQWLSIEE